MNTRNHAAPMPEGSNWNKIEWRAALLEAVEKLHQAGRCSLSEVEFHRAAFGHVVASKLAPE